MSSFSARKTKSWLLLLGMVWFSAAQEDADMVYNDGDIKEVKGVDGNYVVAEDNDVIILTRENFNHVVVPRDIILVEFYAPWCGHCLALEPEYSKAAGILKAEGISLAKVDATAEAELAKEYMVTGYPSLILFRKGEKQEQYEGARTAQAIVEYMKQQSDPSWKPPPSSVIVLTNDNFTSTVKSKALILVEFYAPWCQHCKQLEPEYEAAAKVLKEEHGIPLAKVDGIKEQQLANQYQVTGWPTLKIFRYGRIYEYKGSRDHQGIVQHMKEMAKLPSRDVVRVKEAQNSMDRYEATVMAFFSEKNDLYDEYIVAANEMRGDIIFLHTFKPKVASHFNIEPNTIVVFQPEIYYSKYEQKLYKFSKISGTSKEISEFIRTSSVPLVGQRTKQNAAIKYTRRPLVVVYYDVNFSHSYVKGTQIVRQKVLDVAAKILKKRGPDSPLFAISSEEEFGDELKSLGLEDSGEDVNIGYYSENEERFPMEPVEEFDQDALHSFIRNVEAGKVKPHWRSQPVPKRQEGPVRIVVAKSFQQEVMEIKKDILIEFYAPWCGHCKKLEPVYAKLAKKMATEAPNLVIAKMDATANDVMRQFPISGYPTIFFVPAFDKQDPVKYEGDRSYDSLKEFVDKQSSVFLSEDERMGKPHLEEKEAAKDEL